MRERKIQAGYLLLREKASLKRELLFIRLIAVSVFVCFSVLRAFAFRESTDFFGVTLGRGILLPLSAAGGMVLMFFYFSHRLHFSGRILSLGDSEFPKPHTLLKSVTVLRYILFRTVMRTVKLLWLMFFMSPAVFTGVLIFRTFVVGGELHRLMLYTLISVILLLAAAGGGFYFYVSGRYYIGELLFVRSPRQNVLEAVKSSASFTGKSLWGIALFRIRCALKRGGVFRKMLTALYCLELFYGKGEYERGEVLRGLTFPEPS